MIKLMSWVIIILSCLCFLYSSNQILHSHTKCNASSSSNFTTHGNLNTIIIPSLRNASNHHNHDETDESDQTHLAKDPIMRIRAISDQKTRQIDRENEEEKEERTQIKHIVFGIAASADLWQNRKEYIKIWWRQRETRGVVWLDRKVRARAGENLPEIRTSGDTSHLRYMHPEGRRDALRLSRVVSETFRLGKKDVRWFVMGDDDTIFIPENVVRVLSKYDHNHFYYIGAPSESHVQNIRYFSYAMAYGGGGFAISYPLAKELEKMQDRCMERYPGLYGSDDRMQACMAELGVPLTREIGFHQYDVFGNLLGLLSAHPVTPLVSLHHLDNVEPIFPDMTRHQAVRQLFKGVHLDSGSVLQQSICYDRKRSWSFSVSWGYVVQITRGILSPRELEMPSRTFLNWWRRVDYTGYSFNTRPFSRHPCQVPFVYYMSRTWYDKRQKEIIGVYRLDNRSEHPFCRWKEASPENVDTIVVSKKPDSLRWQRSPRRDCCRVQASRKRSMVYLNVGNCHANEISEL